MLIRNLTAVALASLSVPAFALNPVVVDSAGTGNFTTVQAAINSWCAGGANAGETAPFVIKIKAGSGPYDEALTLDQTIVGQGNIVGNLTIESDTANTKVNIRLQKGPAGHDATIDDGLYIVQDNHSVTFRDIVFSRSISNAATQPMDELVRIDGFAAEAVLNTFSFYNCVFTETKADGAPMVTTKVEALDAPPARGGVAMAAATPFPRLFQAFGDNGETFSIVLDNCVFYASVTVNAIVRLSGTGAETALINNCLSTYAGGDCFNLGGNNPGAAFTVTGTDQKAGPLNCTAALQPSLAGSTWGHCFTIANGAPANVVDSMSINMSKFIAYASVTPSFASARGVSGSHAKLNLSDGIINVPNYGIVDIMRVPSTWDRITLHASGTVNGYLGSTATQEGSLLVRDSIISGGGTKFGGTMPAGGIIIRNSAVVTEGPDAIGAIGGGASITQEASVINADPQYVAKDGFLATFMDVANSAYATGNSTGFAIAGGASYVGAVQSGVNEWSLYQ